MLSIDLNNWARDTVIARAAQEMKEELDYQIKMILDDNNIHTSKSDPKIGSNNYTSEDVRAIISEYKKSLNGRGYINHDV